MALNRGTMSAVVILVANRDCCPSRNSTLLNFTGVPAPAKSEAEWPEGRDAFLFQNTDSRPFDLV